MEQTTNNVRTLSGTVVSDAMDKTCVVAVTRTKQHPIYHKYHKVTTKFHAHDEDNVAKVGDEVTIKEARPRSKNKRWELVT